MVLRKLALSTAAASLAFAPVAAQAAQPVIAPVSGESEMGNPRGEAGIMPTLIIAILAAAGMAALLLTDDDDDDAVSI